LLYLPERRHEAEPMMNRRLIGLVGGIFIAATGFAPGHAYAESPLLGVYDLSTAPPSVWAISSDCVAECVARVKSSAGWQSVASLNAGTWKLSVYLGAWQRSSYPADPATCVSDGPNTVRSQTFTFDATNLVGMVETVRGDSCGGPPVVDRAPVTLTKRN
jgi:hypothetical protein